MAIEKKFPRKLNNSVDSRLRKGDEMIDALNVQIGGDSDGADQGGNLGVVKPVNGNVQTESLAQFENTENRKVIGKVQDQKYRRIYLFVWCSNKFREGVYVYDANTDQVRALYLSPYFNFDQNGFVKGDVVHLTDQAVEGDEKTYLYFTDNINEPRRVDVSRVNVNQEEYGGFDYVDFITACPTSPQKPIEFDFGIDFNEGGSSLEGTSGFQFAYQNIYYSGEISSPSVHSDIAVPPAYLSQGPTPTSELFIENVINLTIPRDGYTREVESIRILVRYGNNSTFFIVDDVTPNIDGDTTYAFTNNNVLTALTELDSVQQFDALPRIAESQAVHEERLFYGNYVENRDRTNATATLTVNYNSRPQELIEYNVRVTEHVFMISQTDEDIYPEQAGLTYVSGIRNRLTGVRLGFGQVPETIEAGSNVRFEISMSPSQNWHLYNGFRSGIIADGGETIHGNARVYIPEIGSFTDQYTYLRSNASASGRFTGSGRGQIIAGYESQPENRINHNGSFVPTTRWRTENGASGAPAASFGTSALNPLIVAGGSVTFYVSMIVNNDINIYQLRRVITDAIGGKNALEINLEAGIPLASFGSDGIENSRVTITDIKSSSEYSFNHGLSDTSYIQNNSQDGRSSMVCAVHKYDETVDFDDQVAPCGYFIVNKAQVEVRAESLREYEGNNSGVNEDTAAGFLGLYVDTITPAADDGILTCVPDFPAKQNIKNTPNIAQLSVGAVAENKDLVCHGFYTFTRDFIQGYSNGFVNGVPAPGVWSDLTLLDAELKATKPYNPGGSPDFSLDGLGVGFYYSYLPTLLATPDGVGAFYNDPTDGSAGTDRIVDSLNRLWGWLDTDSIYYGPSTRALESGQTISQVIRDGFVSVVDGASGPGGEYKTRIGSILSLALSDDQSFSQTATILKAAYLSEIETDVWSVQELWDMYKDVLEYEGSVHLGTIFGYSSFPYIWGTGDPGNPDYANLPVIKSMLPGWGFSNYGDSVLGPSVGRWIAVNYYPAYALQGNVVFNTNVVQSDGGYVGDTIDPTLNAYPVRGYGGYPTFDFDNNSSLHPGATRDDSEVIVVQNRFFSDNIQGASGRTFKSNAFHDFGIVYYDHRGRPGPVNRLGSIYVPGYSSEERGENTFGSSYISVAIENDPPTWAFDYQIVYSGNTSVSDFVQYTAGGAFATAESTEDSAQSFYVSLNYLQGKKNVSYTTEFGARNPAGDPDLYNFKQGDRVRIISYYENGTDRVFPVNNEFDVADYRILTDDVNNNPLYDPALHGDEVPERMQGAFLVLKDNTSALGFTFSEVKNQIDKWNNRCLIEIFTPLKDQDTDERPFYEISQAYPVVFIDGILRHRRENIDILNGDVWWRLAAVNMPAFNANGQFEDLADNNRTRFTGYFIESNTFSDLVPRANVKPYGKAKFYISDEGEVRRRSSITFGSKNNYSKTNVRFTNFNPNALPFKDLSNKYGAINYLAPFDEFMLCIQENKLSRLPIQRNIISDASGSQQLITSSEIVGSQSFYSGEIGTDNNPESVTVIDNDVYFTHKSKKGVYRFNRLEGGVRDIGKDGMEEFFDGQFENYGQDGRYVTGYDPDNNEVLFSFSDPTELAQNDPQFILQPAYIVQPGFDPTQEVTFDDPCVEFAITSISVVTGQTVADTGSGLPSQINVFMSGIIQGDVSIYFTDQNNNAYYPDNQTPINGGFLITGLPAGEYEITANSFATACQSEPVQVVIEEIDFCATTDINVVAWIEDSFSENTDEGYAVFQFTGTQPSTFETSLTLNGESVLPNPEVTPTSSSSALDALELNSDGSYNTFSTPAYKIGPLAAGDYNFGVAVPLGESLANNDGVCFYSGSFTITQGEDPCLGLGSFGAPKFTPNPYSSSGVQSGTVQLFIQLDGALAIGAIQLSSLDGQTTLTLPINAPDLNVDAATGQITVSFTLDDTMGFVSGDTVSVSVPVLTAETNPGEACVYTANILAVFPTDPCLELQFSDYVDSVSVSNEVYIGQGGGMVLFLLQSSSTTQIKAVNISTGDEYNFLGAAFNASVDGLPPGNYYISVQQIASSGIGALGEQYNGCTVTSPTYTISEGINPPPPVNELLIADYTMETQTVNLGANAQGSVFTTAGNENLSSLFDPSTPMLKVVPSSQYHRVAFTDIWNDVYNSPDVDILTDTLRIEVDLFDNLNAIYAINNQGWDPSANPYLFNWNTLIRGTYRYSSAWYTDPGDHATAETGAVGANLPSSGQISPDASGLINTVAFLTQPQFNASGNDQLYSNTLESQASLSTTSLSIGRSLPTGGQQPWGGQPQSAVWYILGIRVYKIL